MSIDWPLLLKALGLTFVLEGLMPLLFPAAWQKAMRQLASAPIGAVRMMGLMAIVMGLLVLAASR
jgi:hypothetical protein